MTEDVQTLSLADLEPKMKLEGVVKQIQLAGAILDVGVEECDAVLHISQIRSKRVRNVRDVLEEGQPVTVWVRDVDKENLRLNVTMIEPPDVTWSDLEKGKVYEGTVVRLEKFGVFVDIGAERPGLVHISELAHDYVKTPGEVVEKGETVNVQVIGVNNQKRQIDLSIKAVTAPPSTAISNEPEEELPTAMALALQRAMEGADEEPVEAKKKKRQKSEAQDDIIRRTLERHEEGSK